MKYYIIKPKKDNIDTKLIEGIKSIDRNAEITDVIDECDVAVLQKGWTRSKTAVQERNHQCFERNKSCREGNVYLERYAVHVN